jgi:hypothetical protein
MWPSSNDITTIYEVKRRNRPAFAILFKPKIIVCMPKNNGISKVTASSVIIIVNCYFFTSLFSSR